jgi:hypothetical protein
MKISRTGAIFFNAAIHVFSRHLFFSMFDVLVYCTHQPAPCDEIHVLDVSAILSMRKPYTLSRILSAAHVKLVGGALPHQSIAYVSCSARARGYSCLRAVRAKR